MSATHTMSNALSASCVATQATSVTIKTRALSASPKVPRSCLAVQLTHATPAATTESSASGTTVERDMPSKVYEELR